MATDSFIDQPGTTAYVLISHGANANTTCYIKQQTFNENIYKNYYSSVPYDNRRHEAQNCSPMPEQEEYQPFIFFYTGTKTDFFDDQIAYSSLSSLLLD